MEVISNSYMPGDLRLVEQLVSELKSQGIFDQFRKECIADVDTKPAYQNLRQRVEGTVTTFLKQQTWNVELNKNQLREHLRKNLYESGFLETGVERIVDQVVNPKISTVFLPKVEEVVYKFLGVEKPNNRIKKEDKKVSITDLLPTDLEAVSPESSECSFKHEKKTDIKNDSLNSSGKLDEDESPAFEPLGNIANTENDPQDEDNKMQLDENSHSSEISGSQNNEGLQKTEMRNSLIDSSNQDSQNSTETRLSIVTSEDTTKMEICEDSSTDNKNDGKFEEIKSTENVFSFKDFKKDESMVNKASERTSESDKKDKRSKSSDKYKDKKDDRHRKSSSSRDRDKYSKHSSYKSSKDRDSYKKDSRDKDRSKERNDKERDKLSKYDREKSKSGKDKKSDRSKESAAKDEKDQEKYKQEKSKSEKEKSNKDKFKSDKDKYGRSNEKDYSKSKEKSDRDKEKFAKDKHKEKDNDNKEIKDRNRTSSSSNNGSNSSKHTVTKDKKKDSNHNSDKKEKNNKESVDSKSKSAEKKKKDETNKHNSNKKETKDPKKKSKDDHYSSKIKKNDRRSTDRDSNDGASSKNNDTESLSSRSESNSQEHSNSSFSGSGDSGNSDQAELTNKAPSQTNVDKDNSNKVHPVKYMKPKFASNINEAMKIMKIRKQLARLEKQNQLSLSTIDLSNKNGSECSSTNRLLLKEILANNEVNKMKELDKEVLINNVNIIENAEMMEQPVKRANLSMENFEALEAKLAQVMSNVNYNSYESDEDYEFSGCTSNNPNLNKDTENKNVDDLEKKDSSISSNSTLPSTKNNHVVINNQISVLECKDECLYLEKPSAYEEKNLKFLKNILSQFEEERDGNRGKKRKLDESIVFKNNIEMQYTDIVHNRRDSNSSNKVVSKANKKRMCNNTDITPDEHFSLPLSPAESDKSGDRKEEDLLIPTKQKRIIRGYSQRYTSEDLYKPRPVIGRRNKFPRHVHN